MQSVNSHKLMKGGGRYLSFDLSSFFQIHKNLFYKMIRPNSLITPLFKSIMFYPKYKITTIHSSYCCWHSVRYLIYCLL